MDEISYQKFLTTRISDLELEVNESLAPSFKRLKKELREHRIPLWPDFYLGNEWGCVNKKISISIPFYLAMPELKDLAGRYTHSRGDDKDPAPRDRPCGELCLQTLATERLEENLW